MVEGSLRFRAACLVGALAAVLIAVAMWSWLFGRDDSPVVHMRAAMDSAATRIDTALRLPQRALARTAEQLSSQAPIAPVALLASLKRQSDEQGLAAMFKEFCLLMPDGKAIGVEGSGKCGAATVSFMKPLVNAHKPVLAEPVIDKPNSFVVMSAPVVSAQGRTIAVIGGKFDLAPVLEAVSTTELRRGSLQLATSEGKLLASSSAVMDDGSTRVWRVSMPLSAANWRLNAYLPMSTSPATASTNWVLLACGVVAVLIIAALAWQVTGRWLAPLKHLRVGVETMLSDPHAHVAVPVERQDEIGKLAEAFNKLMQARSNAVQHLIAEKEWVAVTLNSIADAVVTTDDLGIVEYLNRVAEELTGWSNDEARGKPLSSVLYIEDEETKEPVSTLLNKALAESRPNGAVRQYMLTRRDGSSVPIDESAAPIRDASGQLRGLVFVFRDVTLQRKVTNRARWDAEHDALTGLFNRRAFEDILSGLIRNAGKRRMQSCLMLLDLDHFKQVNDTGGHAAGDALLKQIAKLMQGKVRGVDSCARLGGDEFAILLQNCPQSEALQIAHKIRKTIHDLEFVWNGETFRVGVSIGATVINHETITMRQALQQADEACYQSKAAGRNQVALFEKGIISVADSTA